MAKTAKNGSDKKLRVAFIGAGGISGAHLEALAKMDDVEVVALSDISEEVMKTRAEKFEIDTNHLYTDYQKMLDEVKPDAVDICTPNGLHAPASIAASKAGAHVMVEKPMAMTDDEARQMIDAAKEANKKLVVGFQYRFSPRANFLKQAADAGRFGEPMYVRVQALRRRGIPNWGVFGRKDLQGGGPMIDIGVHMLEVAHYLMGSPKPVAATGMTHTYLGDQPSDRVVSGWAGWDYKNYTVEDLAVGHIRFESGAVLHIEAMFAGHIEEDTMDFQLMGDRGGCEWNGPKIFTDMDGHMVDISPHWLPAGDFPAMFYAKLRDFADHVLYDKPSHSPAEHGLMVQQMLNGVYRSAEQGGKEVSID